MAITAQLQKLRSLGDLRDLDRADWLRLWSDHGPMPVSAVLVVLIAAVFAANVLRLIAPAPAPATPDPSFVPQPSENPRSVWLLSYL